MTKYKVKGYIKIPVSVIIDADKDYEACEYAHIAVSDSFIFGDLSDEEYVFEDESTAKIEFNENILYDFRKAEVET